jgi:hypothetical protein
MNSPFQPPTGEPVRSSLTASAHDAGSGRRRNRRSTALGVSAGLLGGGAVGLLMMMPSLSSAASTVPSDTNDTSITVDDTSSDTTAGTAGADAASRLRQALQPLVDDGTLTVAQADAVTARLAEQFPGRGGPGGEHRGPGGRGGLGARFDGEVLADLLGIDVATLRTELADGATVAEVAANHDVDVQTVIDALVAEAKSHLDLSVTNGRLTQAEADAKLTEVTERITDGVNNGFPRRGRHAADEVAAEVEAAEVEAADTGS